MGCGAVGGLVPAQRSQGYDAIGVDPDAPEAAGYHRIEFERYEATQRFDAVVASTSLHHVGNLDVVLDHVGASLAPGGTVVVIEWAWERFDEPTARWCFERLAPPTADDQPGWLHHHQQRWTDSSQPWDSYIEAWAKDEHLHRSDQILSAIYARFQRTTLVQGPYFHCDLAATTEVDEQAAIDSGEIQATGLWYAGRS